MGCSEEGTLDHARCWGGRVSDSDQSNAPPFIGVGELELLMCLTSARKMVAMERSCRQLRQAQIAMIPWDPWSEQRKIGSRLRARTRAHSDQSCALLCDGAGELELLTPITSVRPVHASHGLLLVRVD